MLLKCSWYEYDMILIWSWYVHDMFMIVHDISGFSLFLLRCYWVGVTWCNLGITSALQGWRVCPGIPPSPGRGGGRDFLLGFSAIRGRAFCWRIFKWLCKSWKRWFFSQRSMWRHLAWDWLGIALWLSYVYLMLSWWFLMLSCGLHIFEFHLNFMIFSWSFHVILLWFSCGTKFYPRFHQDVILHMSSIH